MPSSVSSTTTRSRNPSTNQKSFWQAITVGDAKTVKCLLQNCDDVDINMVDELGDQRKGCTALHLAVLEMPTWKGTEGSNGIQTNEFVHDFFHHLLASGADPNVACEFSGEWYLRTQRRMKSFYPSRL